MPAAPPALFIRDLSKAFQGQLALKGVDLDVLPGEVHALLGENGSGKSTLIKVLSGLYRPEPGGTIEIGGSPLPFGSPAESASLGCRFVHQDLGLVDELSVLDNLALGAAYPIRWGTIRSRAARRLAREELERVGVDVDPMTAVGRLSSSTRTGVAVARALRGSPQLIRLLVCDEPTASMPQDEVTNLLSIIRTTAALGIGVIYVTHRLDEVFGFAQRVTVLRDGRVSEHRPTAGLTHAELVRMLVGTELDEVRRESAVASEDAEREPLLTVSGLRCAQVRDVSFSACGGDIIGFAGLTGSGRDQLMPGVFGAISRQAGEVHLGAEKLPGSRPAVAVARGLAYLPSDRVGQGAAMSLSARENLTLANLRPLWKRPLLRVGRERTEARWWFKEVGVRPPEAIDRSMEAFSGGNQQKILFAKWLRSEPKVLLLDEPTQGVDLATRADLHRRILEIASQGVAVLISSADLDELEALCHRILVLRDGRVTADLSGAALSVENVTRATLSVDQERAA